MGSPQETFLARRHFTDDQVRDIRHSPLSARELAARYGVSRPTCQRRRRNDPGSPMVT